MSYEHRLYRLTHKQTGRIEILRHVDTTIDDEGGRVFWLALPEDPMQCRMSMTEAEIREYSGVKLIYLGRWADLSGQQKHWFRGPADTQEAHAMTKQSTGPKRVKSPSN